MAKNQVTYFRYPGSLRIGLRNEEISQVSQPRIEVAGPKQMLLVLLNGHRRFRLDGVGFLLSTVTPGDPGPKALMLRIGRTCRLEYPESYGSPLEKIAVSTDPGWLEEAGQEEDAFGEAKGEAGARAGEGAWWQRSAQQSGALSWRLWTPSDAILAHARHVIDAQRGSMLLTAGSSGNLALMSRAIELHQDALTVVSQEAQLPLTLQTDGPKIAALVPYLATHQEDATLGPEELARGCGMGLRSLQRLCRRSLNCSPRDFIRTQKLAAACNSLSRGGANVACAAHIAGYSSTASFRPLLSVSSAAPRPASRTGCGRAF